MPLDTDALRASLAAADYTSDAVVERIGELGQEGLGRNCTVPADVLLDGATDPQAALIRLFILQQAVPREQVAAAVDVASLEEAGFVEDQGRSVRAVVDIRPYGSPDDGASGWVVADPTPGLDHQMHPIRPDYVLGVSPASTTLAQLTMRTRVGAALDLGTGCGVQSLHLAQHAARVVATDVNERALDLARVTAALGGIDVDYRNGSLYEPVAGQRFDLIVSNPPFVMSPPSAEADTLAYREANFEGDSLVETLIRGAADHLTPGGSLQLLTNWAVTDEPWQERLDAWIPDGCDAWIIERERLDVFSYIEMWLTDAGLAGTDGWRAAYDEWLGYFERLGIRNIGMGWVLVTRAERTEPHRRFESWPHAVAQPVGDAFARHGAAIDAARWSDVELLSSSPRLVDVRQETLGAPGAADPEHIVLRQTGGFLRAMRLSTLEAAVLGALDGDLTIGQVTAAVASLVDAGTDAVEAEVLPTLRRALVEQFLVP